MRRRTQCPYHLQSTLSTTPASNYPSGTDAPSVLDDVQRVHGSFIAKIRDLVGLETGTYVPATARTNMGFAASGANTDITSVSAAGFAFSGAGGFTVNSTTSINTKIALKDNGVVRGYMGAGPSTAFHVINSANSVYCLNVDNSGNVSIPGSYTGVGSGLTGTAASLTAGAAITDNQHYGVGMTYTAPGKSIGIGYTNSSIKLRKVSLFATSAVGGNNWWVATVAGTNIAISNASVASGSPITLQFEVPPGATYSVSHGSGSTPAAAWFEA